MPSPSNAQRATVVQMFTPLGLFKQPLSSPARRKRPIKNLQYPLRSAPAAGSRLPARRRGATRPTVAQHSRSELEAVGRPLRNLPAMLPAPTRITRPQIFNLALNRRASPPFSRTYLSAAREHFPLMSRREKRIARMPYASTRRHSRDIPRTVCDTDRVDFIRPHSPFPFSTGWENSSSRFELQVLDAARVT